MISRSDREAVARGCKIVLFGLTLAAVLSAPHEFYNGPLDLDALELWSGVGSVWQAADREGFRSQGFDILRIPGHTNVESSDLCEDMTRKAGFLRALALVLRLRPGGLLWMAPVCSSWGYLCCSKTLRHKSIWGNPRCASVGPGNLMAEAAAFFYLLAWARLVEAVVENPAGSYIFKFPPTRDALRSVADADPTQAQKPKGKALHKRRKRQAKKVHRSWFHCVTPRCAFDDAPDGERFLKRYALACTGGWIHKLHRRCTCRNKHKAMAKKRTVAAGRVEVTGSKKLLAKSASYPEALGTAVVQSWRQGPCTLPPPPSHGQPITGRKSELLRRWEEFEESNDTQAQLQLLE